MGEGPKTTDEYVLQELAKAKLSSKRAADRIAQLETELAEAKAVNKDAVIENPYKCYGVECISRYDRNKLITPLTLSDMKLMLSNESLLRDWCLTAVKKGYWSNTERVVFTREFLYTVEVRYRGLKVGLQFVNIENDGNYGVNTFQVDNDHYFVNSSDAFERGLAEAKQVIESWIEDDEKKLAEEAAAKSKTE